MFKKRPFCSGVIPTALYGLSPSTTGAISTAAWRRWAGLVMFAGGKPAPLEVRLWLYDKGGETQGVYVESTRNPSLAFCC